MVMGVEGVLQLPRRKGIGNNGFCSRVGAESAAFGRGYPPGSQSALEARDYGLGEDGGVPVQRWKTWGQSPTLRAAGFF